MNKENLPWYCIWIGLIGYFVGAIYAVDPITISEMLGTGLAVASMGVIGLGVGTLFERSRMENKNT